MDIQLRAATASDLETTFEILRAAFREYLDRAGGWDDDAEMALHRERFGRLRYRMIVADGSDAGYIATGVYPQATERYPMGLYLHQLMMRPEFQSRGIGAVVLPMLAEEAKELGMPLRFRVLKGNPRALAFYAAAGCSVTGESETHFSMELLA